MTYFDTTLEAAPIEEQQSSPVLPEERFIFELIGLERAAPDQWRTEGGIKWTFLVYHEDGSRFVFDNEHYQFWRTTGVTRDGRPNFNVGTFANAWASALLGRQLDPESSFSIGELHQKRMSAAVIWEPQRSDPKKKTIKLASLRHVPVASTNGATPKSTTPSVSADASDEEIDRALIVSKIQKSVKRLKTLDAQRGAEAAKAVAESDLDDAPLADLEALADQISQAVLAALDA